MKHPSINRIAIGFATLIAIGRPAAAATETVLYSFPKSGTGYPLGSVYFHNGALYGTGAGDEKAADGQVFKLTIKGGSWREKTIVTFDGKNGSTPYPAPVRGPDGIFYGTTEAYGDVYNGGNVYALSKAGGKWVSTTIWAFGGAGDGTEPTSELVIDKSGNLFGTTFSGGAYNLGTVFEMSNVNGTWTETLLHSFRGNGDGWSPYAGLLMAGPDTFYGTTEYGGNRGGAGTVFKLFRHGEAWKLKIIYSFTGGSDGYEPWGSLIMDKSGALYGTTYAGGAPDVGVAFTLSHSGAKWTEKVLHTFGYGDDNGNPLAGLAWGPSGVLYGTTTEGAGTVFELLQSGDGGGWNETILHKFGNQGDGYYPQGGIILDKAGALYGTTVSGGTDNLGTVWKITP